MIGRSPAYTRPSSSVSFYGYKKQRDLQRVVRRQRQMYIGDSLRSDRGPVVAWAVSSNMTEGIAEIKQFRSPRKTMKFTLKPCLKPGILSTAVYFLNLIFSANQRSSKPDYDAMCSLANYIIYTAVQNYKKA